MTNRGVAASSFPQVIFSLGTAPLYEPYDVVLSEIWQKYPHRRHFSRRSCVISGTTQMGKSPAMPPPIWKKPTDCVLVFFWYHSINAAICSRPDFTTWKLETSPRTVLATKILPSVESSHPGVKIGRFFSLAA